MNRRKRLKQMKAIRSPLTLLIHERTNQPLWFQNPLVSLNSLLLLFIVLTVMACHSSPRMKIERLRPLEFSLFNGILANMSDDRMQELDGKITPATLVDLQEMMTAGEFSAEELTQYYLARIQKYDGNLNSVMELNPDALAIATQLDTERADGHLRGPLHGIPIMLKDNIATGDNMHNTAGASALKTHRAPRDSFIARQLRDAGAILLGKANLSEWANFMSSTAPSGFSTLGGQVINPFGAIFEVYGSSTGSAVVAATRVAAATIGTETTGSIIAPAAANGVAGMRPTSGLVSRDLIIPITAQLDSAGPMGRSVIDLAVLLTVMAHKDSTDPFASMADGIHGTDFFSQLGSATLDGLRVGLVTVEGMTEDPDGSVEQLAPAITALKQAGAVIVPIRISADTVSLLAESQLQLLAGSMASDVAHYLESADASVRSIDEITRFNAEDSDKRAPYGQDFLEMARDFPMKPGDHEALSLRTREEAYSTIRQTATDHTLDVILSFENEFSIFYANAGVPAVTVPIGLDAKGQPHGATFVGINTGTDASLLAIAYEFEIASRLRRDPVLSE